MFRHTAHRSACNAVVSVLRSVHWRFNNMWDPQTSIWCNIGLACHMVLINCSYENHMKSIIWFHCSCVYYLEKNIIDWQEYLLFLFILEVRVLHMVMLPCNERCSEIWKVVREITVKESLNIFFEKLKVHLFDLF